MATPNPAQLERHLKGVNYPASKAELVKHVEHNGAEENVRAAISNLPNQSYDSPAAVNRAISAMQQGSAQQGSAQQDQDQDQDQNHQDQSQQSRQRAGR